MEQGRLSLRSAVEMASSSPAHFLGLAGATGSIAPGLRADLVLMSDDLTIVDTWIAGVAANAAASPFP
jgi:N-acetylglucosamine-6-phosphate deacetylase